jgi:hypothetical protein
MSKIITNSELEFNPDLFDDDNSVYVVKNSKSKIDHQNNLIKLFGRKPRNGCYLNRTKSRIIFETHLN